MIKIAVLLPLSWRLLLDDFVESLLRMVQYSFGRYRLEVIRSRMSYGDNARNYLAKCGLVVKADYLLWLDGDEVYPEDLPEVLMGHMSQGKDIVGGWTCERTARLPALFKFGSGSNSGYDLDRICQVPKGLFKVESTNFGGVMMKPEIFVDLPFPWFKTIIESTEKFGVDESTGEMTQNTLWVPEDVYFYRQCKDAGIKVWIDGNLEFEHLDIVKKKSFIGAGYYDAGSTGTGT